MKMVYTIAAMLLAGSLAVAADTAGTNNDISEFHQHAMGGQLEITPHLMYDMAKSEVGTASTDITGFRLGSEVEYGVHERFSVGADLSYRSWTADTTPEIKISGLEDVILFGRGSSAMGMGRLAYGLDLGYSLGDHETSGNDVDAQTGGMSLVPYVGYEFMAGPGTLGGQLRYTWLGERTDKNGATETKIEDGSGLGLGAFYEYPVSEGATVGASLRYDMSGNTKTAGVTGTDQRNTLGVSVYAPINAGTNMTVIPRLDWSQQSADNAATAEVGQVSIGAALRIWM